MPAVTVHIHDSQLATLARLEREWFPDPNGGSQYGARSKVVQKLLDDAALCPTCDRPMTPDPDRPGVLSCPECGPGKFVGEAG